SPGINDTGLTQGRALAAADEADVLLWVLTSRQFLSEVEMTFLAGFVARRGPGAVRLVLNVFLSDGTEVAWREFLDEKLPRHLNKLADWAPALGLTGAIASGDSGRGGPTAPVVISARAFGALGGDRFGGAELHRLLDSLDSPERPDV